VRAGALYDDVTQLPDLPREADVEEWMPEDEEGEDKHTVCAILGMLRNAEDPEFAKNLEDTHALYRMITGD